MSLQYNQDIINARLDAITAAAGSGALLRLYDGVRPAPGGSPTLLLSEMVCDSPFAGAAVGGALTAGPIAAGQTIEGLATWFRIVTSTGVFVLDGNAGTNPLFIDLALTGTNFINNGTVEVVSFVIQGGNSG